MLRIDWKARLKNKALWVSVASLLGIIVVNVFNITTDTWTVVTTGVLGIPTALGLFNDPTTENSGYNDDK